MGNCDKEMETIKKSQKKILELRNIIKYENSLEELNSRQENKSVSLK